jgi:hypothetical protein
MKRKEKNKEDEEESNIRSYKLYKAKKDFEFAPINEIKKAEEQMLIKRNSERDDSSDVSEEEEEEHNENTEELIRKLQIKQPRDSFQILMITVKFNNPKQISFLLSPTSNRTTSLPRNSNLTPNPTPSPPSLLTLAYQTN